MYQCYPLPHPTYTPSPLPTSSSRYVNTRQTRMWFKNFYLLNNSKYAILVVINHMKNRLNTLATIRRNGKLPELIMQNTSVANK